METPLNRTELLSRVSALMANSDAMHALPLKLSGEAWTKILNKLNDQQVQELLWVLESELHLKQEAESAVAKRHEANKADFKAKTEQLIKTFS